MASRRFLRVAIDIGSGCTKVCGAVCYREASQAAPTKSAAGPSPSLSINSDGRLVTRVEKILVEREEVLLIGQAVKHASADGKTIPSETAAELHACLTKMFAEVRAAAEAHNADTAMEGYRKVRLSDPECASAAPVGGSNKEEVPSHEWADEERFGIATAIFRSAVNGPAVLASLRSSPALRLRCAILPQDDEAAIGYETARQHLLTGPLPRSVSDAARLVSYDSGAASFQLTTAGDEGGSLRFFNGQWGNTIAHLALMKIVNAERAARLAAGEKNVPEPTHELDPNPVGPDASAAFVRHVLADLDDPSRHPVDAREHFRALFRSHAQVGAGGAPSEVAGENGATILVQAFGGDTSAFMMASRALGDVPYVSREALRKVIFEDYALLTFAELAAIGYAHPEVLLAKLLLVYAVMSHLGIEGLHFQRAIGNTRALVSLDKYWVKNNSSDAHSDHCSKM